MTWRELGRWGTHRIRNVGYTRGDSSFANVILAESSRNIFSPLMKWSGQMPEPTTHEVDGIKVLVLQKDFGGNVPMVSTWAWMWGVDGPSRLDVEGAVTQAIEKVAPGYTGYQTGLDWQKLHCQTGVWQGAYPGKVGVAKTVEAWFELGTDGLVVQRAQFRDAFDGKPATIRWPQTSHELAGEQAPSRPLSDQLMVELRDVHGSPISGLEVRITAAIATFRTNVHGMATFPLLSPMPEGAPVLLELVDPPKPFVVVYPCRGVLAVARSVRTVTVAQSGDPGLLANPVALESLADCILRTAPPQEKYETAEYARHRRQAVVSVSSSIKVTPGALEMAIGAWSHDVRDPLQRGLAALYEQHLREATINLKQATRISPAERDRLARAEFYLARALYAQRHYAESMAAHERAAAISPNDSALLTSWGFALGELRDFAGAELRLRRALSIEEGLYGPDAESVAVLSKYLAGALYSKPDYAGIDALNRRALAIAERIHGLDSVDYAEALHNAAILADTRLDHPAAKALYQHALEIRLRKLGPQHLETADTMIQLGQLFYHQHSCEDSFPLFQKALAIREQALGSAHPATAASLNAMGLCFEETGDLERAEQFYRRALSIRQSTVGEDNTTTAHYMSNLSSLLVTRQRLQEAEPLQRRALAIQEAILGPDHPGLIDTIYKLALLLCTEGHLQEAERLLYRALGNRERISGPDHPDVALLLSNLSALLMNEGKNSEAEPLLRRAVDIQERTVGPTVETAKSLNDLAILLDRKGQPEQSVSLFERALAIYKAALGSQHQETRSVEERLRAVQKKLEK